MSRGDARRKPRTLAEHWQWMAANRPDGVLLVPAGMAVVLALAVASNVTLQNMLTSITATRLAVLPPHETFGSALTTLRSVGLVVVILATLGVLVRSWGKPLVVARDRALLALVGSSLGMLIVELLTDDAVASPRRHAFWGGADLVLVLADAALLAGLLYMSRRQSEWLAKVRRGLDRQWSIEPSSMEAEGTLELLPGHRRGDGTLHRLVSGRGATPVARVDYIDDRGWLRREWAVIGALACTLSFALVLAFVLLVGGPTPPRVVMFPQATDTLNVTTLMVPESAATPPRELTIGAVVQPVGGTPVRANVEQISSAGECLRDNVGLIFCKKRDMEGYVQVKGIIAATQVAAHNLQGCAIVPGGEVRCWRDASDDPMVPARLPSESHLVQNLQPETLLAVGDALACGISVDKDARCWEPNAPPYKIEGVTDPQTLAVGSTQACAVQKDNTVVCWGKSDFGAVGPNASPDPRMAVAIPGITGAVQLGLGVTHSCARTSSGEVWCWGFLSSDGWSEAPRKIDALKGARQIAVADGEVCALTQDRVICVGERTLP